MDVYLEKIIIHSFFKKNRMERAAFELNSAKRRSDCIWHIEDKIDTQYMHEIIAPISDIKTVYDILKKEGAPNMCYVLSDNGAIDGKTMLLKDALELTVFVGPVFISCIHGKLAYYEGEQNLNTKRYLIKKD